MSTRMVSGASCFDWRRKLENEQGEQKCMNCFFVPLFRAFLFVLIYSQLPSAKIFAPRYSMVISGKVISLR